MAASHPEHDALRPTTLVVHAGRPARTPGGSLNPDVTLTSTYHAGGEVGYARTSNPTWEAYEDTVGRLEGGRALAFASGMGAASAVLELTATGATVLTPDPCYNEVRNRLTQQQAAGRLVHRTAATADAVALAAAIREHRPALVWLESPGNPLLDVCDLRAAAEVALEVGAVVACDSTFATPLGQRPLKLGCDVVVHSATKYLAGHSDVLLGVVVTADEDLHERLHRIRTAVGAIPGPMETWLALRGVRTLALRWERAQANAAELARRLAAHPAVARVRYPGLPDDPGNAVATRQMTGFGAMVSFEPHGSAADAQQVCERARLWIHTTSLGGVESTMERRRRWEAESHAVPENLIRLSVGVEDVEDLWDDLAAALQPPGVAGTGPA
jgi:cystathionine gamma-synthase